MNEKLLFGEPVAAAIREKTRLITTLAGITPNLTVLHLGDNADDTSYRNELEKQAALVNMTVKAIRLDPEVDAATLKSAITHLNRDSEVHGVLVQTIRKQELRDIAIRCLHIDKDAEGITAANVLMLEHSEAKIVPCTASAILSLIQSVYPNLKGKKVTIINSSTVIGIPLFMLLQAAGATTTTCNRETLDVPAATRAADIIVTATGKRGLITVDHLSEGQVVIDASIIRTPDNHIVGDVDRTEAVLAKVKAITPVPRGVGPVTVATLLHQTARLCEIFEGKVEHHCH